MSHNVQRSVFISLLICGISRLNDEVKFDVANRNLDHTI